MFYIKTDINEECSIKANITDENVYTICPRCGAEHQVDLQEILTDGNGDLFGTAVFCQNCTAWLRDNRKQEETDKEDASCLT